MSEAEQWTRLTTVKPEDWIVSDVQNWLSLIDFDNFKNKLKIDGKTLLGLNADKLDKLGVTR